MKQKEVHRLVSGSTMWLWSLTLSVTLTWIFMVKVWNRFISGIGRPIDMEWNRHESIIHDHYRDICVTLVRWVGVPDCDWCDFRHQCALDTSTCINVQERYTFAILVAFWPYCDKKMKMAEIVSFWSLSTEHVNRFQTFYTHLVSFQKWFGFWVVLVQCRSFGIRKWMMIVDTDAFRPSSKKLPCNSWWVTL